MIGSDLYQPLRRKPGHTRRKYPARLAALGLVLTMAGGVAQAVLRHSDERGEPFAVGTIERPRTPMAASPLPIAGGGERPVVAFAPPEPDPPEATPAQVVDVENGVKVIRPAGRNGPLVLKIGDPLGGTGVHALASAPDPRLVEAGPAGPLPRIGPDGARPDLVYAHREVPIDGRPAIAILLGGMGLDRASTAEAGAALPNAVTFGFAPYGDDLPDQVRDARHGGHEVILQVPMEPLGPPPVGLSGILTGTGDNHGKLRWLMSRFTGYAGLGNYLGGRILGDEAALTPILRDASSRGLFFADDGTAPRSLVSTLGETLHLPVVRADVVLDGRSGGADLMAAFLQLETLARQRGIAVGSATGRPETIALLSKLIAEAGRDGIVLVPLSQAARHGAASALARTSDASH